MSCLENTHSNYVTNWFEGSPGWLSLPWWHGLKVTLLDTDGFAFSPFLNPSLLRSCPDYVVRALVSLIGRVASVIHTGYWEMGDRWK
jgi:hypothetical protein